MHIHIAIINNISLSFSYGLFDLHTCCWPRTWHGWKVREIPPPTHIYNMHAHTYIHAHTHTYIHSHTHTSYSRLRVKIHARAAGHRRKFCPFVALDWSFRVLCGPFPSQHSFQWCARTALFFWIQTCRVSPPFVRTKHKKTREQKGNGTKQGVKNGVGRFERMRNTSPN